MHQLPPELKTIILSDSPEHDMWDPDYPRIGLCMIVFLAGEKRLIELCKDPEDDIHCAIDSLISNKEIWQASSEKRKVGKRHNFNVVYIISTYGLAVQIADTGYSKKDIEDTDKSLNNFYHRFRGIRKYIAQNAEMVTRQGRITTFFGRIKYFRKILDPEIASRKKASLIRQASSLPVQGTTADYLKLAETNFDAYIRNKGWDKLMDDGFPRVWVTLSIRGEALLMADRSISYEEIILMIRTCMEMPIEGVPPLFYTPSPVDAWAQYDDDSMAMPVFLRDKLIRDYQKTGVSIIDEENCMGTLNIYRKKVLHDYMGGLISKYGMNPDIAARHVRHPSLTYELIARHQASRGFGLDHRQSIRYAVEQYIKGGSAGAHIASTKETVDTLEDLAELQVLVNFDSDGNVVHELESNAVVEEVAGPYGGGHFVNELVLEEKVYVWEFMDALFADISGLSEASANKVISEVWEGRVDGGFFQVKFRYGSGLLEPKNFKVEDVDTIALTGFIKEIVQSDTQAGSRV